MRTTAGWYDDPWNQADLRWWDGRQWTGRTATTSPAAASTVERPESAERASSI
ncbi:DUF2510 domain-containing protein [Mycolicibacterium chlorophenolicum]|uniref:DUF2510 domain-containing protein n=1 Tax=Mycolicibacterium chlorophenolicum TaxID=37916 RepID=UPI0009E3E077